MPESCAIVLTGGGARAAYQVGVLRGLTHRLPQTKFDVVTGVSAGAINAAFLASRQAPLTAIIEELTTVWENLQVDDVLTIDAASLFRNAARWVTKLGSGGSAVAPRVHGLVDTAPLRHLLAKLYPENEKGEIAGIVESVRRCDPKAVAITSLDYNTGRTVTWVSGCAIETWERPLRRSVLTNLGIDHVMASAALPILFPAVKLGKHWHGDGGIRLSAPLSPALHLGATRLLAVSTHYAKTMSQADEPQVIGYPPPAQILGQLVNAIFLDVIDEDSIRLEKSNEFLRSLPPEQRRGYRIVDFLIIRPSEDLGRIAAEYENRLPRSFRYFTRGLGTRETSDADFLSLLMFIPEYLQRLIEIGERDAIAHVDDLERLVSAPSKAARSAR